VQGLYHVTKIFPYILLNLKIQDGALVAKHGARDVTQFAHAQIRCNMKSRLSRACPNRALANA